MMPRLTSLKDNDKGRAALQSMRGNGDAVAWLTETLKSVSFQEKDAPWKKLLLTMEEELRSLAFSRDYLLRLHACSVLVHSENENSRRILWDMLKDSHREIRIFLAGKLVSSDRHRLYNTLFRLYLNDPVLPVREAAYQRIRKEFSDLYMIQPSSLSVTEKIHCLELLETSSSHDHNLALEFLKDSQPGVVLSAALFLEKSGTLDSLIKKARLRDMDDLERRVGILKTAADHSIVSFLQKKDNLENPGSLLLALTIYEAGTGSDLFAWTLEKIFALGETKRLYMEMKQRALRCLAERKDPETLTLVRDLLKTDKNRGIIVPFLLEHLPSEGSPLYYPVLKGFLLQKEFPYWDSLHKAFRRITLCSCLSDFFTLVKDTSRPMEVRRRALVLLAGYREYSSTLFLLEHLDLLNRDDMKDLSSSAREWDKEVFTSNVTRIFKEPDARLHQSLMELLSAAGIRDFITSMEENLQSPVAGTRISALHALRRLDSRDSTDIMKGLFYDTEQKVQAECASVFIEWDREECFDEVYRLLKNGFEEDELHTVILDASAASKNYKLLPILTVLFEENKDLTEGLLASLEGKNSLEEIRILTRLYSEGSGYRRECLRTLFTGMGEVAEGKLMLLLSQEAALRPSITEILEKTGYVDSCINRLKGGSASKRLKACEDLCAIATLKACRGLLKSAKDINRQIRKMSLDCLRETSESQGYLNVFKEDPDKKIRRLALWAEAKIEKDGRS